MKTVSSDGKVEVTLEQWERLRKKARLLQKKRRQVAKLAEALAGYEDEEAWRWTRHRVFPADPSPALPVPRLEIRYEAIDSDAYNARALYSLVYRHYTASIGGVRGDGSKDCIIFVPIGETRCGGGGARALEPREAQGTGGPFAGRSYGPFRDGAHIRHEMRNLRLPGFIIGASGDTYVIDLEAEAKVWEKNGGG